ncbi:MAG: winged helix-turn-helix domain-containing protein [Nitrosarchaeum sp.]
MIKLDYKNIIKTNSVISEKLVPLQNQVRDNMKSDKSETRHLKRVDIEIMGRIISTLYDLGSEKKTVIARRSNVSYDNFILYLEFLDLIGFVKRENQNTKLELVTLTDQGKEFYLRRLSPIMKNL